MSSFSFCDNCNTLLQPIEVDGKLILKCRTCEFSKPNDNPIISRKIYTQTSSSTNNQINTDLIYDNTLPHTNTQTCPNGECPSAKDKTLQKAVFYSDSNSLHINYICETCKTHWHM